ncbi:hypothetical protein G6M89_01840 [Natronolimnobius sp. AArcel1]|uniref:hypothetical protein n=1 Tax=Natronolimnobius sp. AArcel1 TaxID=1679093 RepID=UPI0013EC6C99|nr:hypothetical protein [Natronolimnobius sp. AArcel1]NGM67761.1 hypothetical protein [Natronolimnobius sp. AArcel1]
MNRTRPVLKLVFAFNMVVLLLLAFSYPFLEPGSDSYVAATITLVLSLVMLALVAVLTYTGFDAFDKF